MAVIKQRVPDRTAAAQLKITMKNTSGDVSRLREGRQGTDGLVDNLSSSHGIKDGCKGGGWWPRLSSEAHADDKGVEQCQ
jgi:hypothetical protein